MDGTFFIQDLAIVLLAAGIAGAVCKRLGLSVIVGFLAHGTQAKAASAIAAN